jgi:hypothetical protein
VSRLAADVTLEYEDEWSSAGCKWVLAMLLWEDVDAGVIGRRLNGLRGAPLMGWSYN